MYYTVYKTTNLINGKIYVGAHKTNNLYDEYLGSGKLIGRAITKYGKENFEKDIIAICDTEEEMLQIEKSLVTSDFIKYFSTYNRKTFWLCLDCGLKMKDREFSFSEKMEGGDPMCSSCFSTNVTFKKAKSHKL